jgi:DNA/RNA-binding domain of Phe-tRNA-synthetase-like protein
MDLSEVLRATAGWKSAFPSAVVGVLVLRGVDNPEQSAALEVHKRRLETDLRAHAARVGRDGIDSEPVVRAYVDYYRARGKTYQVKAQWESVALEGKPIPRRAALVEAMFMAELKNLILTAGHDLAALALPLQVDETHTEHRYRLLNDTERVLDDGDMMMVDGKGIVSSVLHGPDRRTRIRPETREVLFAVYAPAGVGENVVREHLEDIRANVRIVAPDAENRLLATLQAGPE